jgi:predicted transcriptional regulator of viral defense system
MTAKNKKQITVSEETITFTKTKHMWGYEKINYKGFEVFMADKEKTVIDGLLTMKLPVDEINNTVVECDTKKLTEYAIKTGNKSIIKKVGYLMEHNNMKADNLLDNIDGNYVPLDGNRLKKGVKNRRWKIIVNTILE